MPLTQKGVRSFLGLANYYRKFIKDFYKIVGLPPICLLKESDSWICLLKESVLWNSRCHEALDALKRTLTSSGVLKYPNFNQEFEVHIDASGFAVGGVLMQERRPIAFESKKLTDSQLR